LTFFGSGAFFWVGALFGFGGIFFGSTALFWVERHYLGREHFFWVGGTFWVGALFRSEVLFWVGGTFLPEKKSSLVQVLGS
jgi:hypothetical protein